MTHFDPIDHGLRDQYDDAVAELIGLIGAERAARIIAHPLDKIGTNLPGRQARMADYLLTVICSRSLEAAENQEARRKQAAREVSREVQNMIDRAAADDARRAATVPMRMAAE